MIDISDPSIKVGDYFIKPVYNPNVVLLVTAVLPEWILFAPVNSKINAGTFSSSKNYPAELLPLTEQEALLLILKHS